jgi:antitoxin HicB
MSGKSHRKMETTRTYSIVLEPELEGGYSVSVPALPGCFTRGENAEECLERASEAIDVHIAGVLDAGETAPDEVGPPL